MLRSIYKALVGRRLNPQQPQKPPWFGEQCSLSMHAAWAVESRELILGTDSHPSNYSTGKAHGS